MKAYVLLDHGTPYDITFSSAKAKAWNNGDAAEVTEINFAYDWYEKQDEFERLLERITQLDLELQRLGRDHKQAQIRNMARFLCNIMTDIRAHLNGSFPIGKGSDYSAERFVLDNIIVLDNRNLLKKSRKVSKKRSGNK